MAVLLRKNRFLKRLLLLGLVAGGVVALDQVSKAIVLSHLSRVYSMKVVDGFFSLTLVLNPGVAFGLFSQSPAAWKVIALLLLSGITVIALLWYYFFVKDLSRWMMVAFCLILGGALGNMIDRFRFSKVVDFLDFYWQTYHWPAFNLADAAITIGVLLLLFDALVQSRKKAGIVPDSSSSPGKSRV
ncbi:MAG: signal peptidase II [Pseudomonadota bacterium]|nr:signal peptidase II [Pseudomonadota bacterium]